MSAFIQDPPSKPDKAESNRDTGFPEPLSKDRNTTLPHPDADRSSGASIEAQDIALSSAQPRRSLLSFQHHNNKRETPIGLSHGFNSVEDGHDGRPSKESAQGVEGKQNISNPPTEQRAEKAYLKENGKKLSEA